MIAKKEIVKLSELRQVYIDTLDQESFPNENFQGEKLKLKLEKDPTGSKIQFAKTNPSNQGCISHNLVYSANISVADAVVKAYRLGAKLDDTDKQALQYRENIESHR